MDILESDKSVLAKEWEEMTGVSPLLSSPGNPGIWYNSEYVRYLENLVLLASGREKRREAIAAS